MKLFKNKYRIDSTRLNSWDYGSDGHYFITICTRNRSHFFGKIENRQMELSALGQIVERCLIEITTQFSYARMDEYVVMPDHIHCIIKIDNPSRRDAVHRTSHNKKEQKAEHKEAKEQKTEAQRKEEHYTEAYTRIEQKLEKSDSQAPNEGVLGKEVLDSKERKKEDNQTGITHGETSRDYVGVKTAIVNNIAMQSGGFAKEHNPMLHDNVSKIIRWYKGRTAFESRKIDLDFAWQPLFWDHVVKSESALKNIRNYIKNNPIKWESNK